METRTYYGEYTLKRWIELVLKGNIKLPEYQRHFVWTKKDTIRLIQSIKNGQFIPPITVALHKEDGVSKNLLLDGQQRLTSLLLVYLGVFPDKSKFYEKDNLATEDDSELDSDTAVKKEDNEDDKKTLLAWTFEKLLELGNIEQIKEGIKGKEADIMF